MDSDSDNEGVLNNIQRLVIRPPGHTGKAKKGHICFDGSFETMNLGRVDFITNQEYDIFIRPDTANPRPRFWFHFTVENTQQDQRVIFNVVNLSKWRSLFAHGLTPVVKSSSRPRWQRMPSKFVYYYRSPLHQNHFILSFGFNFDRVDERYHFAVAQPYSWSRHRVYVDSLLQHHADFLLVQCIGRTIQNRPLELITISEAANLRADEQEGGSCRNESGDWQPPKVVVILGRIHASESASSFIIQGLIDFLTSSHIVAQSLRSYVVFKIIPVMNPDGVFMGNTLCNALGQDLNRCWRAANGFLHPSLVSAKKLIHSLDRSGTLDVILDIHAHTSLMGLFMVGNAYNDVYRFERHTVLPRILAQICPDFSMDNTIYNNDASKDGTARRYFCDHLSPEVNAYTLEASIYGYSDADSGEPVPYTDEMYCRIGRNVARAFWDYYKILGLIPLEQDGGEQVANVRSFNLLRLREIEQQRQMSSVTFDMMAEEAGPPIPDPPDRDEPRHCRASHGSSRKVCHQAVVPVTVKRVLYSSQDEIRQPRCGTEDAHEHVQPALKMVNFTETTGPTEPNCRPKRRTVPFNRLDSADGTGSGSVDVARPDLKIDGQRRRPVRRPTWSSTRSCRRTESSGQCRSEASPEEDLTARSTQKIPQPDEPEDKDLACVVTSFRVTGSSSGSGIGELLSPSHLLVKKKLGGGGCVSNVFHRSAPRPQPLRPSVPLSCINQHQLLSGSHLHSSSRPNTGPVKATRPSASP